MKSIKINGNIYKIEYSIEASLYEECSECVMDFFVKMGMADGAAEIGDNEGAVNNIVKTITGIPVKTLTLFYAGLLEHHSDTIRSKDEAKTLLKDYLKESGKSFVDVFKELTDIVNEDNFFEMIGLNQMFQTESNTEPKKKKKGGENTSTEQ